MGGGQSRNTPDLARDAEARGFKRGGKERRMLTARVGQQHVSAGCKVTLENGQYGRMRLAIVEHIGPDDEIVLAVIAPVAPIGKGLTKTVDGVEPRIGAAEFEGIGVVVYLQHRGAEPLRNEPGKTGPRAKLQDAPAGNCQRSGCEGLGQDRSGFPQYQAKRKSGKPGRSREERSLIADSRDPPAPLRKIEADVLERNAGDRGSVHRNQTEARFLGVPWIVPQQNRVVLWCRQSNIDGATSMRRLFRIAPCVLPLVAAAQPAASDTIFEVEHARTTARVGGPETDHELELIERWGAHSGTSLTRMRIRERLYLMDTDDAPRRIYRRRGDRD